MVEVPQEEEQQQGRGGGGGKRNGGTKNPALQHIAWRKYLNHPGVPGGTLFEREQMAAKMRQAETAHKVKQHKVRRFGGQDDQLEESGEGNKTVRGANSGIMSLGARARARVCVCVCGCVCARARARVVCL